MKHKISYGIGVGAGFILLSACSVELKDRNSGLTPPAVNELVVDGEQMLAVPKILSNQQVLKLDRMVLGSDAKFITQGANVRIEIKELISENGHLQTFLETQRTAAGTPGRHGGNLEVVVGRLVGRLYIEMRGENGGDGLPGAEPDESLRGEKGAEGRRAGFSMSRLGGMIQAFKAESGAPGGRGKQGFSGGNGAKGGNTGTLSLKIEDAENGEIFISKHPGDGGREGLGGRGGPGGEGGEPGNEQPPSYRGPKINRYAQKGPPGEEGPRGPSGLPGERGLEDKACRQLGGQNVICE